jgi:hypothetical protein
MEEIMTYYEALIALAQNNYDKIHINLIDKTIKIGKRIIIENGEIKHNKIIVGDDVYECDDLITDELDINVLYSKYKYSSPGERDGGRHYFKALSSDLLTDEQLIYGMPRLEARVRLEAYILLGSIKGLIKWDNPNHWFWQGEDKDFIILKRYI